MDETTWLTAIDPLPMLSYLLAHQATPRKLRLLACGWCRRWWGSLTDQRTRQAIIAAEDYADRRIKRTQLREVALQAGFVVYDAPQFEASAYNAVLLTASDNIRRTIRPALAALQQMARWEAAYECVPGMDERTIVTEAMQAEQSAQCEVIRELWGNPFRYLPIAEEWQHWNDGTLVKLAQAIYDERNFADLPVLADALMDAGCTDNRLLDHLKTPAGHALGCWALDALLGRQ